MSLLALGVSHRTAPVPMLERLTLAADAQTKLLHELSENVAVDGAMVVATCNRVEVYVEADKFHPAVDAATEGLARATGVSPDELVPHLYVHYEVRAVQHRALVYAGRVGAVGQADGLLKGHEHLKFVGHHDVEWI